ncbi:hypothetical protein COCSUDRAFT_55306 [Coccomyxa subellipsoidea C-169]|uniref:Uncharacterized protein n=1 Tax=Coccomyxa subellipsoidea (strain C-169) TaxID=574566 RepID=I0Z9G8_COCSC|nr:hypothetical protein COCSUDRAFT_55306 [Coccomyxa subellipsoidea C-169]EIE27287.1 hypothetical protein COCSUDRAFT_55306 [Coccomyxa subellipsoidea C-169]|eukprot:XP_005651831.1 hypothetical protein COCSUDRAFT_55306 [Coccomyxa subellipsoidea C-169]
MQLLKTISEQRSLESHAAQTGGSHGLIPAAKSGAGKLLSRDRVPGRLLRALSAPTLRQAAGTLTPTKGTFGRQSSWTVQEVRQVPTGASHEQPFYAARATATFQTTPAAGSSHARAQQIVTRQEEGDVGELPASRDEL